MNRISPIFPLILRVTLVFIAMLIAFVASSAFIGVTMDLSPEQARESGIALVIVSLINALVFAFLILRSRWGGFKLIAAVALLLFGVSTFMSQIETLFFINALKMPIDLVMRVIAAGGVRALIFAPLAVFVLGKIKSSPVTGNSGMGLSKTDWLKRFAILAVAYVIVYFGFGYFVAFQWKEARDYYAGTFSPDLVLPLFQLLRGALWAALALPIVKMLNGSFWETGLIIGLVFAIPLASGVLFPNPYMPSIVRQAHFFELTSSMLAYGLIAGWVWTQKSSLEKAAA